jgi:hypothetical protein
MNVVVLAWDIIFIDSDEGGCHAGEGLKLIKGFNDFEDAVHFINKWNPVIRIANKENIVFPIQPGNQALKDGLGFTLHNFDQDTQNFRLEIQTLEVA